MKKLLFFPIIVAVFLVIGCSHPLRITNQDEYFSPPSPPAKTTIRLGVNSPDQAHIQNSRYISAIIDALQRTGNFEKIIYPYNQSVHQGQVDIVVDISVNPRYSGMGSNFFVNWPGFLIFAPAIWGYGYIAEIDTNINITHLKDNRSQSIAVPTKYKIRQAEIDRTWTEISWLEVSAIAFIGGIVFTQYDPDITDEFITKVSPNYGPYVAKKIAEVL